jgi:hypothetical protein
LHFLHFAPDLLVFILSAMHKCRCQLLRWETVRLIPFALAFLCGLGRHCTWRHTPPLRSIAGAATQPPTAAHDRPNACAPLCCGECTLATFTPRSWIVAGRVGLAAANDRHALLVKDLPFLKKGLILARQVSHELVEGSGVVAMHDVRDLVYQDTHSVVKWLKHVWFGLAQSKGDSQWSGFVASWAAKASDSKVLPTGRTATDLIELEHLPATGAKDGRDVAGQLL